MSALNMHGISAPVFVRMLKNLSAMLAKGEAHAKTKNYDCAALLNSRLAPDMFTLTKQVQIATDHVKGAMARLGGHQPEAIEDKEATVAELQARIAKVIAIIEGYKEADLTGSEKREITIKIPNAELKFSGIDYHETWAIPNFYFHVAMAYAILRHNGVELGKRDFLMS